MPQYALIFLHVAQCVLFPLVALAAMLRERALPLSDDSPWWWGVLLAVIAGFGTSLTYGFKLGFFDVQRFGSRLFVDRRATAQFLLMVLVPLGWLAAVPLLGVGTFDDAEREAGVLVFAGHHLVLALLRLFDVIRRAVREGGDAWAVPVLAWRLLAALLALAAAGLLGWTWARGLSTGWLAVFLGSLALEWFGSVPLYAARLADVFPDE